MLSSTVETGATLFRCDLSPWCGTVHVPATSGGNNKDPNLRVFRTLVHNPRRARAVPSPASARSGLVAHVVPLILELFARRHFHILCLLPPNLPLVTHVPSATSRGLSTSSAARPTALLAGGHTSMSGSTRAPGFLHHLALRHLLSSALVHQIVEVVLVNLPFHLLQLQDSNARPQNAITMQRLALAHSDRHRT
jgi:hypothetical protein